MRPKSWLAIALAGLALSLMVPMTAAAYPITYDFQVTGVGGCGPAGCSGNGPFTGDTADGSFTYDSSSITPGGTNGATGLLTALNFTWDGTTYNAATVNTGWLTFDASGNLTQAEFGNFCAPGPLSSCGIAEGSDDFYIVAEPGLTVEASYSSSNPNYPYFYGIDVTTSAASVPEPSSLAVLLAGLSGLAALRRRRQKRVKAAGHRA